MTSLSEAMESHKASLTLENSLMGDDVEEQPIQQTFGHWMVDIETMSTHPTNALILSIGMVQFDPTDRQQLHLGERRLLVFDPAEQLLLKREVDPKTQEFWAAQPDAASSHWRWPDVQLRTEQVWGVMHDAIENGDRYDLVWAYGTVFDLGNLSALFRQCGLKEPWHYRAPRDARTFCDLTVATRIMELEKHLPAGTKIIPHDPISDCIVQAHAVWERWPS